MRVNDDGMLLKYKEAKFTDEVIAKKMGITPEEVQRRWETLVTKSKEANRAGYFDLCEQYRILCQQYQLLGESLKIVAGALGEAASSEAIRSQITKDPEETLRNLCRSFIILKPFTPADPEKMLEETIRQSTSGN